MGLVKRTYVDGETVITADNLNDIQDEIIQNASDISTKGTYSKPSGGIPSTDMTTEVQTSLGKADTALQSSDIDSTLTVTGKAADAKKTGDEISGVKNTLSHKADLIYDTASGDIASFPDGADGLPVKDLTVGIEPVQDTAGGDPSPTHICPISGWTGCNVTRTGKNLLDPSTRETNTVRFYEENGFLLKAGQTYTLSVPTQYTLPNGLYIKKYGESGSFAYGYDVRKVSFTPESDVTAWFDAYYSSAPSEGRANIYLQLELGSTATDYEPYSGNTIPISWQSEAGTVYGGTLDVTSGVLTVDRGITTKLWSEMNPESSGSGYISRSMVPSFTVIDIDSQAICNIAKNQVVGNNGTPHFFVNGTNNKNNVYLPESTASDTSIVIVQRLASPVTYQLTPTEIIETLLGQNNIWSDCGPSTVEYPADTKLYIQKINTPTDDDMIADANIASGQYFIVNNNLYLSTAAILAGDPIKPGTNCTLTNLAAALNALNS